ncbi:pro-adrenomedullin [Synchiropus splendidus]|uniref:pro-adrenomedullin n=1 Tax=Synchiropus splendidus TaxID=270530 RepID=UPI00237E6F28|nr:pro-adrenomedullin [Synchiropus splendidus]
MRLTLHTLICCCVLSVALPVERGATEDVNSSQRKRLRVWMQSHIRRSSSGDIQDGPQTDGTAPAPTPTPTPALNSSSAEQHSVQKRSAVKVSACVLFACSYHELLHRLYQITNKQRDANAPEKKMGSGGYGRRRRSLSEVTRPSRRKPTF